jgi:hypothetical protein
LRLNVKMFMEHGARELACHRGRLPHLKTYIPVQARLATHPIPDAVKRGRLSCRQTAPVTG